MALLQYRALRPAREILQDPRSETASRPSQRREPKKNRLRRFRKTFYHGAAVFPGVPSYMEFAEYSNYISTNLHRDACESAAHVPHRREISRAAALTLRIASSGHFQIG